MTDDIQDMINSDYIYAYIDLENKTIVLQSPPVIQNPISTYPGQGYFRPKTQPLQAAPSPQKIDLNTATEQQLASLPGVGIALAKKLLK